MNKNDALKAIADDLDAGADEAASGRITRENTAVIRVYGPRNVLIRNGLVLVIGRSESARVEFLHRYKQCSERDCDITFVVSYEMGDANPAVISGDMDNLAHIIGQQRIGVVRDPLLLGFLDKMHYADVERVLGGIDGRVLVSTNSPSVIDAMHASSSEDLRESIVLASSTPSGPTWRNMTEVESAEAYRSCSYTGNTLSSKLRGMEIW